MYAWWNFATRIDKKGQKLSKSSHYFKNACYLNPDNDRSQFMLGFVYCVHEFYLNAIFHYFLAFSSEWPHREITSKEISRVFRICNSLYESMNMQSNHPLTLLVYCFLSIMYKCIVKKDLSGLASQLSQFDKIAQLPSCWKDKKSDILSNDRIGVLTMNVWPLWCLSPSFALRSRMFIRMRTFFSPIRRSRITRKWFRSISRSAWRGSSYTILPKRCFSFPFCSCFSMPANISIRIWSRKKQQLRLWWWKKELSGTSNPSLPKSTLSTPRSFRSSAVARSFCLFSKWRLCNGREMKNRRHSFTTLRLSPAQREFVISSRPSNGFREGNPKRKIPWPVRRMENRHEPVERTVNWRERRRTWRSRREAKRRSAKRADWSRLRRGRGAVP